MSLLRPFCNTIVVWLFNLGEHIPETKKKIPIFGAGKRNSSLGKKSWIMLLPVKWNTLMSENVANTLCTKWLAFNHRFYVTGDYYWCQHIRIKNIFDCMKAIFPSKYFEVWNHCLIAHFDIQLTFLIAVDSLFHGRLTIDCTPKFLALNVLFVEDIWEAWEKRNQQRRSSKPNWQDQIWNAHQFGFYWDPERLTCYLL